MVMLESIPKSRLFSDIVSVIFCILIKLIILDKNDLGEDAKMALPETGLAIIPGYVLLLLYNLQQFLLWTHD